ncbi:MAG: hypothetical protein A3C90_00360 [Candidatus Magasanikbacteria bacterium RIFCSPHIGHO2_02_FULL_51_14]|uniref:Glycosyltransferase subfamily 4-like N-terminal domain-containing protein n=1 Tax=Candidatus Magasanikbacteria bacterium RIFCSPHIGHO2_02_FULL_51_14 TaxID=1798683 RepID=A0A1F6MDJ4_9BACT|nr:MAG: hypothetical protein A3C90_00360 [Candidatus Magasanikbacteria bacterium RIFCSPHIGHO2_02_FULL_51_14]
MKIAHIVSTYPPYYGGMGNVVFQTASALTERGHEVVVYAPGVYEEKEIKPAAVAPEKVHAPELTQRADYARRLRPTLQYGNAARMPQVARELDAFDIVHLHYPFFGTAGIVRRWKMKNPANPLVITYHMDTRGPGLKGLIFDYYGKYWMPKILRSADALIASSFDYLGVSDAQFVYRENKEKWKEIPFGVDTERFKPREKPRALFERHGLNPDAPTVIFVGGMDEAHYFKGIPVLLKALVRLEAGGTRLQAVFVGDGNLRSGFENAARLYGLSGSVRFVGHASDEELPYYYNMADLCVLPSINRGEAFGLVLLEAMASGVPVLATDLPGVRAVAKEGGFVVAPNDVEALKQGLSRYFEANDHIDELKRRVQQVAEEKYSWEIIGKRLEEVYLGIV